MTATWTITDIERIPERAAKLMAYKEMEIKGHNIYFVDFEGYFGFSCLVFKNGHHIFYANDYAIHHPGKTREELEEWYIDGANNKLFTEEEIAEPLKDYDEYSRKAYYLTNYYGMQEDHVSIFYVHTREEEAEEYRKKFEGKFYNPVSFAYYDDKTFVDHHIELYNTLGKAKKNTTDNYEYQKNAFKREMFNHEYGINWQADYDVLSTFGNIKYTEDDDEVQQYFEQLGFTDLQRKAYYAAKKEYYAECKDY